MMEVYIRKCKIIAKEQLPAIYAKCEISTTDSRPRPSTNCEDLVMSLDEFASVKNPAEEESDKPVSDDKEDGEAESGGTGKTAASDKDEFRFGFPNPYKVYAVNDCRNLVKTLVCGVKAVAWGLTTSLPVVGDPNYAQGRTHSPRELNVFRRLLKYGLLALDIYTLVAGDTPNTFQRSSPTAPVRTKDEKEVLEHFGGVFPLMNIQNFKELFSENIHYLVTRISENYALQIIANGLLTSNVTSPVFASILVNYLLDRMPEMGKRSDRSNLHLKLFKLVFLSVNLFPQENSTMLKPHLRVLVNKAMHLALTANEPHNYFLLLRALFRSIGGGTHDLLYQEFLPLLPNLLQGLNNLQGEVHRQQMRELFVELCLTVPVRLSSLLPYLPMLMDPLVAALSGSPTLITQGLRTLELCVDNLQPDFLYEHIAPVRAPLMQALWKTVGSSNEQAATVAFRILGKFGGSNRKMLIQPQSLPYSSSFVPPEALPCVTVRYQEHAVLTRAGGESPQEQDFSFGLPLKEAVDLALYYLVDFSNEFPIRQHCWQFTRVCLLGMLNVHETKGLETFLMQQNLTEATVAPWSSAVYKCPNTEARVLTKQLLEAMFYTVTSRDLRSEVLPLFLGIVRHFSLLALVEQAGNLRVKEIDFSKRDCLDSAVLAEVLAVVLGNEDKELCKAGLLAIATAQNTCALFLGSTLRACNLPFMLNLFSELIQLIYQPPWFTKMGGCIGIKYFLERLPEEWLLRQFSPMLDALMFAFSDLQGQVSNGCLEMLETCLRLLVKLGCGVLNNSRSLTMTHTGGFFTMDETVLLDKERRIAMSRLCHTLIGQLVSSNEILRQTCKTLLDEMPGYLGKSLSEILNEKRDRIVWVLNLTNRKPLSHHSAPRQLGFMDAFAFIYSLNPPILRLDGTHEDEKRLIEELLLLGDTAEMFSPQKVCYNSLTVAEITNLRVHAIRALTVCYCAKDYHQKIFSALFKCLTSSEKDLQEEAQICLSRFLKNVQVGTDLITESMRPLLLLLSDFKSLNLEVARKLSCLTKVFPIMFSDRFCDQLLSLLKKWMEVIVYAQESKSNNSYKFITNEMETCSILLEIFHQIPAATQKFVDQLASLVAQTEYQLKIIGGEFWRSPLLKFLARFPTQSVEFFLSENSLRQESLCSLFFWCMKQPEGAALRSELQNNPQVLFNLLHGNVVVLVKPSTAQPMIPQIQTNFRDHVESTAVRLIALILKRDPAWLPGQRILCEEIRKMWSSPEFRAKYEQENLDVLKWQAPTALCRCLLICFKSDIWQLDLLFEILLCFVAKYLGNFSFVETFTVDEMLEYDIQWKRAAFIKFIDIFHDPKIDQLLKAKVLQYVIIPCVQKEFEAGNADVLIGSPPAPDVDTDDNLISVFVRRVIDAQNASTIASLPDPLSILMTQLSCLFVQYAAPHIHDTSSKKQGSRLRQFMLFAWPSLQANVTLDPTTRYHGHLLIAHIIAKFAINRKIVLQVFHSLLKAHGNEARSVVQQALQIVTPAVPMRMEDGYAQLSQLARKILIEDGHTSAQLLHILHLIVRQHKIYYPERHSWFHHLVNAVQKLGFAPHSNNAENRRLALDVTEVMIDWELHRISDAKDGTIPEADPKSPDIHKPMEKVHVDLIVNFLIKFICQISEPSSTSATGSSATSVVNATQSDGMVKRCYALLKICLKPTLWGNVCDLKLQWLDKNINNAEQTQNANSMCTCLEIITFLLENLPNGRSVNVLKSLQQSVARCLAGANNKVVKCISTLLTKVIEILKENEMTLDNLDFLTSAIAKTAIEGLGNYDKLTTATPSSLFATLSLLKVVSKTSLPFLDRLNLPYMKIIQKLTREYISPQSTVESAATCAEMLALCMDLMSQTQEPLTQDLRKQFIHSVLSILLEKSTNPKILASIIGTVEQWVKHTDDNSASGSPTMKEKQMLLVKLMTALDDRFSNLPDLGAQFLQLVLWIFQSPAYQHTEIAARLEKAFMAGLKSKDPDTRLKFFQVYDFSIGRSSYDRLYYIMCSQNWEWIGPHYWIKQCLEVMFSVLEQSNQVRLGMPLIPCFWSPTDGQTGEPAPFFKTSLTSLNPDSIELDVSLLNLEDSVMDIEVSEDASPASRDEAMRNFFIQHKKFLGIAAQAKTGDLLKYLIELVHLSTELAEPCWIALFSSTWSLFSDQQIDALNREVIPFLSSGAHCCQQQTPCSTIRTFTEAFARCQPPVHIKPFLLSYLSKNHGLWERGIMMLEDAQEQQHSQAACRVRLHEAQFEVDSPSHKIEVQDSLADLYQSLNERDMWFGVWLKRAKRPETIKALLYEQQGMFTEASRYYEKAMALVQDVTLQDFPEYKLWEERWILCCRELNEWDILKDTNNLKQLQNPFLMLDISWRIPSWGLMKEGIAQVESMCPTKYMQYLHLYRGYLSICNVEEQNLAAVEKHAEQSSQCCIKEWRRLPKIVSPAHVPLLQFAQIVMELSEAAQLTGDLQPANLSQNSGLQDLKAIVKTWKNRLPTLPDRLTHWSEVGSWRQLHYQNMISVFENLPPESTLSQHAILGIHSAAQIVLQLAKTARKQGAFNLAENCLARLHTMPNLPVVDGYQKVHQQIKRNLQKAKGPGGTMDPAVLNECLAVIETCNVQYFNKEMTADLYTLRGTISSHMGSFEDANKAFSAALQLYDGFTRGWSQWAEHLERVITKGPKDSQTVPTVVQAVICNMQACRQQQELKARKHVARVMWLLNMDNDPNGPIHEAFGNFTHSVPQLNWVMWIPQLFSHLRRWESTTVVSLLCQAARCFPQIVYSTLSSLGYYADGVNDETSFVGSVGFRSLCKDIHLALADASPVKMWALESLYNELDSLSEHWAERSLRQFRGVLGETLGAVYDQRGWLESATLPDNMKARISAIVEDLRPPETEDRPLVGKIQEKLRSEFDWTVSVPLLEIVKRLIKWAKTLETKARQLPSSQLISTDKCGMLATFCAQTAELELPGELLYPKQVTYCMKIARFYPHVEVVWKNGVPVKRVAVRGNNGRKYYFLLNRLDKPRQVSAEQAVYQLQRLVNPLLLKNTESASRLLQFHVPCSLLIKPSLELLQDTEPSISMLNMLQEHFTTQKVCVEEAVLWYYDQMKGGAGTSSQQGSTQPTQLKEVLRMIEATLLPSNTLLGQIHNVFEDPAAFYTFRNMFCSHLAVINIAEYIFQLTALDPGQLVVERDSGFASAERLKFITKKTVSEQLDASRPAPFRLTPCLSVLLGPTLHGRLAPAMIATARALQMEPLTSFLRLLLWHVYDESNPMLLNLEEQSRIVKDTVASSNSRQISMAAYDDTESQVRSLILAALNVDNLCMMDPSWHPWF